MITVLLKRRTVRHTGLFVLLALLLLSLAPATPRALAAATLAVTTNADTVAADGACSLREAIAAANSNTSVNECLHDGSGGADTIVFAIAGAGVHTITPGSGLPAITEPVLIDGYSQPGASANTLAVGNDAVLRIELNGDLCSVCQGLVIAAGGSGSTIRGLAMYGRFNDAIALESGGGNTVAGNFLGLHADGSPGGVLASGVYVDNTSNNTIGGATPAARNVIAGNRDGIFFASGAGAVTGNVVQGNYIGVNPAGTAAGPGNSQHGILMGTFGPFPMTGNTIGGTTQAARNVIAANGLAGIDLSGSSVANNSIQGNYIGANASGATLGNAGPGIAIASTNNNAIGGTAAGAGNLIANNAGAGVALTGTANGNAIQGNTFANNSGLGIDIDLDGITPNDAGDGDAGPNNRQNFPSLSAATASNASTAVQGTIASAPGTQYRVEFFASPSCDPSLFGEGQTFLGATTANTDASGAASFSAALPIGTPIGQFVTATATDPAGNTSEFSACVAATPATIDLNNHAWTDAYRLTLTPDPVSPGVVEASVDEHLAGFDQSAWFKFSVQPGARVSVQLTNLPANYDLVLYKDIAATYSSLTSETALVKQSAEFAPNYISPNYISPNYISPNYISPNYISPNYISPNYI
ncbi:MAG TPA: CSLREA domain-containing protein, partial [Roseiflexaceae bacterium]|nr:CSLREA domain-containing protein [Roseiflexaceae bacterium]